MRLWTSCRATIAYVQLSWRWHSDLSSASSFSRILRWYSKPLDGAPHLSSPPWNGGASLLRSALQRVCLVCLLGRGFSEPAESTGKYQLVASMTMWRQHVHEPITPRQTLFDGAAVKTFAKCRGSTVDAGARWPRKADGISPLCDRRGPEGACLISWRRTRTLAVVTAVRLWFLLAMGNLLGLTAIDAIYHYRRIVKHWWRRGHAHRLARHFPYFSLCII